MPGRRRQVLGVEVDQQVPVHRPDVVVLLVEADERVQGLRILRPADPQDALVRRSSSSWRGGRRSRQRDQPRPATRERERDCAHRLRLDRPTHRRLENFERLRVAVEPHPGAERHRRHVLAVADRHVRDRRDPERRDQLVEDLLDRERRLRALGQRSATRRLTSVPKTKPGDVVELAGADQVVERGVDQVRLGVQVLDHQHAAVGLDLEGRADARRRAGSGSRRPAAPRRLRSPTVSTYGILRVLEHAAERLGLEGSVEPLLGLLGELVLVPGEAQEVRPVEASPSRRGRRAPGAAP